MKTKLTSKLFLESKFPHLSVKLENIDYLFSNKQFPAFLVKAIL